MIIFINNWKRKALRVAAALVIIIVFLCTLPLLTGIFNHQIPVVGKWFQEEHPSGNPMRVEQHGHSSNFDHMLDQFVIKIQDFYYEE